ncbi:MAG: apolipoprotein N-acyltransferase [Spirochaetes bacterium]|nr:apolipoprotein N-acyltransferase [Spirochaetota bacterium]
MLAFAERFRPRISALAGASVGAAVLAIVCRWLASYHPGAIVLAIALGAFWFSIALAAISAVLRAKSRFSVPAAAFIWAAAELGRSTILIAFPYATLPYALADSAAALGLASVGGVALVGLATAGSNVTLYAALRRLRGPVSGRASGAALRAAFGIACALAVVVAGRPDSGIGGPSVAAPTAATPGAPPAEGWYRVALLQPCVRSQKNPAEYAAALERLMALSDEALAYGPDLVAWHETAVVPPIEWHLRHRPDRSTYDVVAEADEYLRRYPSPVVAGNGYAVPGDVRRAVEHNSALLYSGGSIRDRYDKVNLVPFSEYLPSWAGLPALRRWIVSRFGNFWSPGSGPKLFTASPASFAAPICFEDSFGRYFASFDAPDFFVVLTNDSWARSAGMQEQHLAMSRFRAAETGAMVLRAADTGATVAIASNGAVAAALPPFERGALVVDVPLGRAITTPYESIGKASDIATLAVGLILVALCAADRRRSLRIDKNGSL